MFQRSLLASSRALAARPAAPAMSRYFTASAAVQSKEIFVANLPYETTQEQLEAKFAEFGNIQEVRIAVGQMGRPKGFAFVTFSEEQALGKTGQSVGEEAIQALSEQDFMGRPMLVKPREQKAYEPRDNNRNRGNWDEFSRGGGGGYGRDDGGYRGRSEGGYRGRSEGGYRGRSEGGYRGRGRGGSSYGGRGGGGSRRGGGGYGGHDNGGYTGEASF